MERQGTTSSLRGRQVGQDSEGQAEVTGPIASPSSPSVRLTALLLPLHTNIRTRCRANRARLREQPVEVDGVLEEWNREVGLTTPWV